MKDRNAFTLAEVLITLSILGVVAAMTIPNIIHSYKKTYTETRLKQAYSILENTLELAKINNGNTGNINQIFDEANSAGVPADYFGEHFLKPYVSFNEECKVNNYNCKGSYNGTYNLLAIDNQNADQYNANRYYRLVLKNGMSIGVYKKSDTVIWLFVDINGKQNPNRYGYDTFLFSVFKDNGCPWPAGVGEYCYKSDRIYAGNVPKTYGIISENTSCNMEGLNCSAVIKRNGWKIPDDYPIKF